ncbi:YgaP family membrane protein [Solirubrum puertoriconensis]|uniref:Inner membrane protein YgaP-like transmembrane domain-containing protein n=1 Tax=Solirubrum puertoriconensis TaxID=1751427 RepID=A0A9X0HM86_SOLP1|nr:DUF2892 domain-containing protein [Solirubrum puertoriconensis]KUG08547.1 hypothetical protein ASU33_10335 [Solirubrum puertoriconensis]
MQTNVGTLDREIRLALGAALILIALLPIGASQPVLVLLLVFGGLFLLTGGAAYCPIYAILDISTEDGRDELEVTS